MTGLRLLTTAAAALAGALAATSAGPAAGQPEVAGQSCPALWVLGVQGTSESSPGASETVDAGMLGHLLGPVAADDPSLIVRSYISYPASFGGAPGTGGGTAPYTDSASVGLNTLLSESEHISATCPGTSQAIVGYSQGAQVVSGFAQMVGTGEGPVAPERVAAVILYSDPDRAPNSPVIAGRPGQTSPDPAPGTSGAAVSRVNLSSAVATGGGIATTSGVDYGALTGRVADICDDGDLSCSAPDRAALLRVAAQLAAQADLRDPIAAIGSIQNLLSAALGDAWTTVVLNDFQTGLGTVAYVPAASLAERLIEAADFRTPAPGPDQTAAATARWAEITATVAAHPVTTLPPLAAGLSATWGQLCADNADLVNPAVLIRYADIPARHTGYAANGHIASGAAWLTAAAHDLAGGNR
ncbi:cutinase family protein [Nocardia asteroides]|uniref:cutinase family protein n=1 Tax=Nocardia asteroides TaxID=1824 RepID=UPI001E3659EA|nr:cutinase family protein [Nocardia asteroides]UGT53978.1 cutinase family protein [Nocardia asteroides]